MSRSASLLMTALAALALLPAAPSAAQAPGLVAAYGFEEGTGATTADQSGNANTGTLAGAVWTPAGRFGNALAFDGTSALVTIPDDPTLDLTDSMTIEAWVYPTHKSVEFEDVVSKADDAYFLSARSPGDAPAAGGSFYSAGEVVGSGPLVVGKWTHLAAAYGPDTNHLEIYVNGVLDVSRSENSPIAITNGVLSIGGDSIHGRHFAGLIDEVRIYDRILYSPEIQADMNAPVVPGTLPPFGPDDVGQWSAPLSWPLVAIHMTLMQNGKVLVWDDHTDGQGAQVFDPVTEQLTAVPFSSSNLFCSGHSVLPDGRVFVTGGHAGANFFGIEAASFFDPATSSWSVGPPMDYRRWYPTNTTLSDGRVLVVSGSIDCETCIAAIPEIYDPATNGWIQLSNAPHSIELYPHMFLLPDGRVFASSTQMESVVSVVLDLESETWTTVDPAIRDGGSAVAYLPGRIMKSGTGWGPGRPVMESEPTTYVIEMNQPAPLWEQTASMMFARTQHNTTMLPDGSVLVTGGAVNTNVYDLGAPVYAPELWDPVTRTWQTLASASRPRMYHSTALLLPDARVLVAGGGRFGPDELSAEIYSPPYLFQGPRPTIAGVPAEPIPYGVPFFVETPDAAQIAKVSLIRPGSVTHAFNQDQRFVPLTFEQQGNGLNVTAPSRGGVAPPGHYRLFLVDGNGVPSVGAALVLSGNVGIPALPWLGLAGAGACLLGAGIGVLRSRSRRRRAGPTP